MTGDDVTRRWLTATPVEALLCRDLRHAWPRPQPPARPRRGRKSLDVPPDSDNIVWKLLAAGGPNAPRVLERTMLCAAGCQVRRIEVFVIRDGGRLVRTGKPRLKYPSWYRRTPAEPGEPLPPLDAEVLRGNIIGRMYPGLSW